MIRRPPQRRHPRLAPVALARCRVKPKKLTETVVPAQAPQRPATMPLQNQILNLAAWVEALVDVVGLPQVAQRLKERQAEQAGAAKASAKV